MQLQLHSLVAGTTLSVTQCDCNSLKLNKISCFLGIFLALFGDFFSFFWIFLIRFPTHK